MARPTSSRRGLSRNAERVVAVDTIALMDALKIDRAIVAGFDWGGRAAVIMAALWPGRCAGLVSEDIRETFRYVR
ncbi:MAG: alpha/beta fold hydrolase [Candidatus Cybelea sp.]